MRVLLLSVLYLSIGRHFFSGHPYIGSTTVLPDILLKIARDKTFERLIKLEKGKHTHRICGINRRNKFAQEMLKKSPSILHCGTSNWKVESNRRQGSTTQ